ncbi:MAG TPA: hexose kinase [Humisphaera sp.]|jgi:tagatose 6-phosphate kinase|nr:hexose kinase [Humisphaera sp.]
MILCLGPTPTVQRSMIFDHFRVDEVNRATRVSEYASGKSPNVARVLRTLGADVLEVGFAGGDRGQFLLDDLRSANINCEFVTVDAPTRLCTTIIDRATGTATELVEESAAIESRGWEQMDRLLARTLPLADVWVFSGSLPPGAPQDFYARWLLLANQRGVKVIIDTRGEPLRLALKHPGFIAKLNRDELATTMGTNLDSPGALRDAVVRSVPAGGASIVTMGAGGAMASDGRNVWQITPPKVQAVSAVGSGDAFAAGLALELSRGKALADCLALAAACGAANALTDRAGHVLPADVERLSKQVIIAAA